MQGEGTDRRGKGNSKHLSRHAGFNHIGKVEVLEQIAGSQFLFEVDRGSLEVGPKFRSEASSETCRRTQTPPAPFRVGCCRCSEF